MADIPPREYYNAVYNSPWIKANGREYPPMKWADTRTIRLVKMPEVEGDVVPHIKAGIEELIEEADLGFRVEEFMPTPGLIEGVNQSALPDGRLDKDKLLKFLVSYKEDGAYNGGRRWGDSIITDKVIFAQEYKDFNDIVGIGLYAGGVAALSIPSHDEKMKRRAIISLQVLKKEGWFGEEVIIEAFKVLEKLRGEKNENDANNSQIA